MANKTELALVTGASAGIGEAFARGLASEGSGLVLVARRRERLEALAQELGEKHKVAVEVLAEDLATGEGVATVEQRIAAGDVDLLINNAGFGSVGAFNTLPLEREMEQVQLNVVALAWLTHAALNAMAPKGRGGIINIASMAAYQPLPYQATYAATKAYVLHFSEAVHEEAKRFGVTVTAVCPGPVPTEFQEVAGIPMERMRGLPTQQAEDVARISLDQHRSGRAICIPDVRNQFLASTVKLAPRFVVRQAAAAMWRNVVEP
jgi:short-subunit dehydrogenase